MTGPRPLPHWFRDLMTVMSGLGGPHTWKKPAPKWALEEHARWTRWNAWLNAGKPEPRPRNVWYRVPTDRWPGQVSPTFSAWELRRQWLRKFGTSPPPAPVPPPAYVDDPRFAFWRRCGAFVNVAANCPPSIVAQYGKGKIGWAAYQLLDGLRPTAIPPQGPQQDGIDMVGWVWLGDHDGSGRATLPPLLVEHHALAAVALVRGYNLAGLIINGEKPAEGGHPEYISTRYVREFRKHLPDLPLGWSPEPRLDMDWAYLRSQGVAYMPQAYPLESGWTVPMCMTWAHNFGFASSQCNVLVQLHGDSTVGLARSYVADCHADKMRWMTLYPMDQALSKPEVVDACLEVAA